jgi:hypothetical protein
VSYITILSARARKELLESWVWYEERVFGLGDRFENEVYKRIKEIEQNPEKFIKPEAQFQETRLKDFPFLIIYRVYKEQAIITISSIFHTSRNPASKYR